MKRIKIKQNNEEWLEYRKGKSGGSEFKDLWVAGLPTKASIVEKLEEGGKALSPADKRDKVELLAKMLNPRELAEIKLSAEPKEKYWELIAESVAKPIDPNDYADRLNGAPFSMMERGHILESEAAEAFTTKTGLIVDGDEIWESDINPNIFISPDRYVVKDGEDIPSEAVEIKCLSSPKIVKAFLTGRYPEEYEPQVVKYFVVNENLQKLYFVLYTDVIQGLELQIWEITREQVEPRIADAKAFEEAIMQRAKADIAKIAALGF